ncbi:phage head closure protein [Mesorhizobium sp. Pch-S]|uniref:phage head closure protein n=1 Tax=Mesorhizobium sp. Pch-S TaxID=2082387 RepID=UPI0013EB1686|nr:phage head closure protein [Mesorhizobium sp. Pch-S]
MAMPASSNSLRERVAFDKRGTGSDGGGGVTTPWQETFSRRAAYVHRNTGEAVMADRLQSKRTLLIRVRADSQTRTITGGWRARDARTGQAYNILDATPTPDRRWVDILAQTGGPNG